MERKDSQQQQRAHFHYAGKKRTPHFAPQVLPALIMLSSEAVVLLQASHPQTTANHPQTSAKIRKNPQTSANIRKHALHNVL
jgi:hypothetical protein